MKVYGLLGYPLSHSFSKKYFEQKFSQLKITDCEYKNFSLENFNDIDEMLANPELRGFNVTIPYKEKIISRLHWQSDEVKNIGACNCVKIINKKLFGYNTDCIGFEKSLKLFLKPVHNAALIFGTGGAAKAVAYVLQKNNINFQFVSRKENEITLNYENLSGEIIAKNLLLINTTPVGMYPNENDLLPIDYSAITPDHYLFDLIYNPEKTNFLKMGEAKGATIQNGQLMLELQADEGWRIWQFDDLKI